MAEIIDFQAFRDKRTADAAAKAIVSQLLDHGIVKVLPPSVDWLPPRHDGYRVIEINAPAADFGRPGDV